MRNPQFMRVVDSSEPESDAGSPGVRSLREQVSNNLKAR